MCPYTGTGKTREMEPGPYRFRWWRKGVGWTSQTFAPPRPNARPLTMVAGDRIVTALGPTLRFPDPVRPLTGSRNRQTYAYWY